MQAAAMHPRPIRLVLELDHAQLGAIVSQLVTLASAVLATRPHPTTPPAPVAADDADPAPVRVPEHDPPRPVAHRQQAPAPVVTLPPALRKYKLGSLCRKPGHEYQQSGRSLRRGTHCVECEKARNRARQQPKAAAPTPARPSLVPGTSAPVSPYGAGPGSSPGHALAERPALPPHLALTCFLSPITCQDPTHLYRETAYTLRFLDTEVCCQCVTQQSQTALAGD